MAPVSTLPRPPRLIPRPPGRHTWLRTRPAQATRTVRSATQISTSTRTWLRTMTGVSCGTAVQEYLQTGVYEGKKSYNAVQYFADESLTSPAYAVTNNAHGLYPKDTFYPDEAATFTWSMWVKNGEDGVGKTTNKW